MLRVDFTRWGKILQNGVLQYVKHALNDDTQQHIDMYVTSIIQNLLPCIEGLYP